MVRLLAPFAMGLALAAPFAGIAPAYDVKPNVKPLVELFAARYRAARTLRATFLERYTENGRVVRVEAGIAYFRRPGKMRWEYEAPERNLFLVDGKSAWFYVPADHTATRVPAKVSTDWRTPLALLAGEMKVARVCAQVQSAIHEQIASPGDVMLHCKPRGAGSKSRELNSSETTTPGGGAGEAIFFEIVKTAAAALRLDYSGKISECHHVYKLDAPSGTAVMLQRVIKDAGYPEPEISSSRKGEVVGVHELSLDSLNDSITLRHDAKSRRGFAEGAVRAAEWLKGSFGIDVLKDVQADDQVFLRRMLHRRHLLTHNGGKVDQEYLDKSGDTTVRLHERIHIRSKEAYRLIKVTRSLASNLVDDFNSMT